jgi:hypothetical protein
MRWSLFLLAGAVWAQDVPTYRAGRTVDPIRIDGKLDEFTWAALPRVGRFRTIRGPQATPQRATNASVAWDDRNLYVAFICRDPDPWSRMKNRDDRLWEEEVVEVFLDPDGDTQNYPELEVSPNNVVVDLLIPRPRSGNFKQAVAWDIAGLQTAVARHTGGWTVEIAMPWKSLAGAGVSAAPKPGDRWRVGLYRIERPGGPAKADRIAALQKAGDKTGAEKLQENDEYLAWSPTRGDRGFHDPERFGIVEFVEAP